MLWIHSFALFELYLHSMSTHIPFLRLCNHAHRVVTKRHHRKCMESTGEGNYLFHARHEDWMLCIDRIATTGTHLVKLQSVSRLPTRSSVLGSGFFVCWCLIECFVKNALCCDVFVFYVGDWKVGLRKMPVWLSIAIGWGVWGYERMWKWWFCVGFGFFFWIVFSFTCKD